MNSQTIHVNSKQEHERTATSAEERKVRWHGMESGPHVKICKQPANDISE